MSINEMEIKVNELRELRRMADELAGEITAIEDEIKAQMTATSTDELTGPTFKITWKTVTSTRLDSKALKAAYPDLVARYSKPSTATRFTLT